MSVRQSFTVCQRGGHQGTITYDALGLTGQGDPIPQPQPPC